MSEQDLERVAFPRLEEAEINELAKIATARTYRDGQTLFAAGDRGFKFFVVRSGHVEIVENSSGAAKTVRLHEPREFTGDVDMLTGRPAIVSAVARGDTDVLEIDADVLRRLIAERPDLGDRVLHAFIARRHLLKESGFLGCRVIGSRYSRDTFRVRDFLAKNQVPFTWVDLDADPVAEELLRLFHVSEADTPVVCCGTNLILKHPSNLELAEKLGIRQALDGQHCDLLVVGAGPAGLAAAVYGSSEGLNTVVIDALAAGGQAGCSMRIENYLGFPTGLTGVELAERATLQAQKFGARLTAPVQAIGLDVDGASHCVRLEGGECVGARCVLIATGANYRRLDVAGLDKYEGLGVYYAATPIEAQMCRQSAVVVVGGGNSAGQAAVFLAESAQQVLLVVRGDDLATSMSRYLARRIETTANIELLLNSAITQLEGDECLRAVVISDRKTGGTQRVETPALFSFIGASPRTDWLPDTIAKDPKGFLLTGRAAAESGRWTGKRPPYLLETSCPGIFAAGDVRYGSSKRVAAAVGEGSMAVQFVHEYLAKQ